MALRKMASELTARMGVSFASASQPSVCIGSAVSRAYATILDELKYAKSHEWVKVEGNVATIGISDFAQSELGDVVYVELPEEGAELSKDESFGVVESVKTASDVYMPVSGKVVEANTTLSDEPAKVNSGPYADGWLIKVEMSDPSEVDAMMDGAAYGEHIA